MGVPPRHIQARIREQVEEAIRNDARQVWRITDYLLVMSDVFDQHGPAGAAGPSELGNGVRLERLAQEFNRRLGTSCEPRGEDWRPGFGVPVVQSYVRTAWDADVVDLAGLPDATHTWDHGGQIYRAVQLSRLVADNGTTTQFGVRAITRRDGSDILVPSIAYESHTAYRLYPDRRNWLTAEEARQLASLMAAYESHDSRGDWPLRVGRAIRRTEMLTRDRYLEEALPGVVRGLESLLKVGKRSLAQQFAQRVSALAEELDVAITSQQCFRLYDDRSTYAHGGAVDLAEPHVADQREREYRALVETLRRAVRRAIEDRDFSAIFEDDEEIRARWPAKVIL